jgi:potassium/hydrogen antiporter
MTYYVLIALCIIIVISYVFDLTGKYTKVPGVLLLIISGMFIRFLTEYFQIFIPDLSEVLPMMGTLGLILIVLEGSLDLTISSNKKRLIVQSILAAILLLFAFIAIFAYVLVNFYHHPLRTALINGIPLGIISSAVAIPSAIGLKRTDREFITYESSISDIVGILCFDFLMLHNSSVGSGIMVFIFEMIVTIIVSVLFSVGLAFILHKINHHVKYVIITTVIILVYSLAKLAHLPSLLVVLIFGLIMNNNNLFKNKLTLKFIDFEGFNSELISFKHITGELTFVVRSFFFIMFGYYTEVVDLLNVNNVILALGVTLLLFLLRVLYFRIVLKNVSSALLFFAPKGLITILLFLGIPADLMLPFMNKGLITQVIFMTIVIMAFGNIFLQKVGIRLPTDEDQENY